MKSREIIGVKAFQKKDTKKDFLVVEFVRPYKDESGGYGYNVKTLFLDPVKDRAIFTPDVIGKEFVGTFDEDGKCIAWSVK